MWPSSRSTASAGSGIALLRRFGREDGPFFLLVSKRPDVVEKVLALELGAADFVESSISARELAARVSRLVARRGKAGGDLVVLENATIDLKAALVMHRNGDRRDAVAGPGRAAQAVPGKSRQGADARRHHGRRAGRERRSVRPLDRFAHRQAAAQARHRANRDDSRHGLQVRPARQRLMRAGPARTGRGVTGTSSNEIATYWTDTRPSTAADCGGRVLLCRLLHENGCNRRHAEQAL